MRLTFKLPTGTGSCKSLETAGDPIGLRLPRAGTMIPVSLPGSAEHRKEGRRRPHLNRAQ